MRSIAIDRAKGWVTARCPCGKEYTAGTTTEGVPVVLHELPTCHRFEQLEPTEFLESARRAGAVTLDGGGDWSKPY